MKSKKVLVLGATGNLGAYSAVAFKNAGYDVIAAGKRKSDNGFYENLGIPYFSIDIINKSDFECLKGENIDIVANFAGQLPSRDEYDPQLLIKSITEATLNILEFMREEHIKKIIFPTTPYDLFHLHGTGHPMSSDAKRSFPLTGDHSVYAIAKNAAVDLIEHYHHEFGIDRFIFRFFTIYQYHPNAYHFADTKMRKMPYRMLMDKGLNGDPITIYGNPERVKEMVYIKDFIQAVVKAADSNLAGGFYNIAAKERVSLDQMIHGIVEVFSSEEKKSVITYDESKPDTLQSVLDMSKTQIELGYQPQYSYIDMLKDIKKEMIEEPFARLWNTKEFYENLYSEVDKE
ncbi:NAD(P)-dependent oxidoreductase [Sporosarcina sp. BP05]|uniref:NAD-dependent epimerase/dehydratase family protein n=1 Tax=Sporosarcina sp. BP05 TaxID=2758726 RepID=UPI00164883BD|nr:NAD(P)-dependent oxidoreductase [Sporosarcina sp. BP05]